MEPYVRYDADFVKKKKRKGSIDYIEKRTKEVISYKLISNTAE